MVGGKVAGLPSLDLLLMGARLWRRTYFYVRSDSDAEQRAAHREIHGPSFSGPSKTLLRNSLSTELGCYRGPLVICVTVFFAGV